MIHRTIDLSGYSVLSSIRFNTSIADKSVDNVRLIYLDRIINLRIYYDNPSMRIVPKVRAYN